MLDKWWIGISCGDNWCMCQQQCPIHDSLSSSIWSARTFSSQSRNVSTRVCHVRGFPRPKIHSWRILRTIRSGSPWHSILIPSTRLPVSSLRRRMPKLKYLALTFWGILSFNNFGKDSSSISVTVAPKHTVCSIWALKLSSLLELFGWLIVVPISVGGGSCCEVCFCLEILLFGWLVVSFPIEKETLCIKNT